MNPIGRRRFLGLLSAGTLAHALYARPTERPPVPTSSLPQPMFSVHDHCALGQLASIVAQNIDQDDSAAFADCFSADAKLDHDEDSAAVTGPAAWHRARRSRARATGHFNRFQILTPVVEIMGDEACLTAHCTADFYQFSDRLIHFQRGWLQARARRQPDGTWRFTAWSVRFECRHPSPPPQWLLNGRRALAEIGHAVSSP